MTYVVGPGTGRCARCGRRLTDPVSAVLGIGPVCRARAALAGDLGPDVWQPDADMQADGIAAEPRAQAGVDEAHT